MILSFVFKLSSEFIYNVLTGWEVFFVLFHFVAATTKRNSSHFNGVFYAHVLGMGMSYVSFHFMNMLERTGADKKKERIGNYDETLKIHGESCG